MMMNRKLAAAALGLVLGLVLFFLNHFIDVRLMSQARAHAKPKAPARAAAAVSPRQLPAAEATPPKVSEPPPGATALEARTYCRLKRAGTRVPLEGRLKLMVHAYEVDEHGEAGIIALVQSSECPEGLFSNVRLDASGRIKEERDCRTSTKEELFTSSGLQGEVIDNPSTPEKLNVAVSGSGYFVYDCGAGGIFLTRSGDFYTDGSYVTFGAGCHVLDRDGRYFEWDGSRLDHNGCGTGGACLALVEPDPAFVEYVDRNNYRALGDPLKKPVTNGFIFSDSLEVLDDPSGGPTGPYWPAISDFQPPAECP